MVGLPQQRLRLMFGRQMMMKSGGVFAGGIRGCLFSFGLVEGARRPMRQRCPTVFEEQSCTDWHDCFQQGAEMR